MSAAAAAALAQLLRAVRYPAQLPQAEAASGSPAPLLPALGWLLCRFSKHIAALLAEQGLQLAGASDLRFVEGLLKFARDGLGLRPALSAAQFLSQGFAERKLELACDVVRACRERHNAAARQERLAALKGLHTEQRLYGAAAAAAARSGGAGGQPEQQRELGKRQQAAKASSLPKPPPQVRVVSAAQQQQQQLAQAAAPAGRRCVVDQTEVSPEGSEADGSAVTPVSVVAAAAGFAAAGPGMPAGAHLAAATAKAPPPSPAEQPRLLPQPLVRASAPPQGAHASGDAAWSRQPAAAAQPVQPLPAQPRVAPRGMTSCLQAAQPSCQQLAAPQQQLAVAAPGAGSEHQARRLIEELQLRLGHAEEAAAAARLEAQQAREQLQARVTVLEGRVRFLEAGFELAPAQQQQQLLLEGGSMQSSRPQQAQPPALAWAAPRAAPRAEALRFGSAAGAWQAVAHRPGQHGQAGPAPAGSLQRSARSNPLFDSEPSSQSLTYLQQQHGQGSWAQPQLPSAGLTGSPGAAAGSRRGAQAQQSGPVGAASTLKPPAAQQRVHAAATPSIYEGPLGVAERHYSSTSELIAGMQARFSEAEGFLLSLQQL
ncbi:hypothetical protein ABPG75_010733 [Micractinium tetrahymenae]